MRPLALVLGFVEKLQEASVALLGDTCQVLGGATGAIFIDRILVKTKRTAPLNRSRGVRYVHSFKPWNCGFQSGTGWNYLMVEPHGEFTLFHNTWVCHGMSDTFGNTNKTTIWCLMLVHYYVPLEAPNWATSIPPLSAPDGIHPSNTGVEVHFLETSDWDHVQIFQILRVQQCNKIFGE